MMKNLLWIIVCAILVVGGRFGYTRFFQKASLEYNNAYQTLRTQFGEINFEYAELMKSATAIKEKGIINISGSGMGLNGTLEIKANAETSLPQGTGTNSVKDISSKSIMDLSLNLKTPTLTGKITGQGNLEMRMKNGNIFIIVNSLDANVENDPQNQQIAMMKMMSAMYLNKWIKLSSTELGEMQGLQTLNYGKMMSDISSLPNNIINILKENMIFKKVAEKTEGNTIIYDIDIDEANLLTASEKIHALFKNISPDIGEFDKQLTADMIADLVRRGEFQGNIKVLPGNTVELNIDNLTMEDNSKLSAKIDRNGVASTITETNNVKSMVNFKTKGDRLTVELSSADAQNVKSFDAIINLKSVGAGFSFDGTINIYGPQVINLNFDGNSSAQKADSITIEEPQGAQSLDELMGGPTGSEDLMMDGEGGTEYEANYATGQGENE